MLFDDTESYDDSPVSAYSTKTFLFKNKYINKRKLSNAIAMVGIAAVLDSDTKVLKEYKGYASQSKNFPSLRQNYGRFILRNAC